jgi:ferredoxin
MFVFEAIFNGKEKQKNKKLQFKKFVECGICYSVCSGDANLMKSNDLNPDTVEIAIWIVDRWRLSIIRSVYYVELARKFTMCNPLPNGAGIGNYISKYLTKIVKCCFSAFHYYLPPSSRLAI